MTQVIHDPLKIDSTISLELTIACLESLVRDALSRLDFNIV